MSGTSHLIELKEKYSNKWWRMNNLYWIIDKKGNRVAFKLNWVQEKLFDDLWYMNIILKARQFGITTMVDIYYLDECVFNPDVEAGIIAHNKDDVAKIFRRKVQYPYRNLPDAIKDAVHPLTDSKQELALSNNSIIYVGTSMRSGTLQYLHVSEHGKICRKYPEKAEEIKTGSLNAVETGQMIVIESTAEGAFGDFYDYCQTAKALHDSGAKLTPLDFKFHFYPWYLNPEYTMDADVNINDEDTIYFNNIERSSGVTITNGQRVWYVKKRGMMGAKMKQEFPSTPEEAFEGSGRAFDFTSAHVCSPLPVPRGAQIYMTFDYGYGAPYSVGWWWVDGEGRVYRFAELYGADPEDKQKGLRQSDSVIAEAIVDKEKDLNVGVNIIRLADPTCFNKKPDYRGGGQGPSTAEVFVQYGLYISPGDPSRELKLRQFAERLRLYDDQPPMLMVYDNCKDFIRTIPTLVLSDRNPSDIDTTGDDHCYDEACHICMARPLAMDNSVRRKKPLADVILDALESQESEDSEYHAMQALDEQRQFEDDFDDDMFINTGADM